MEIQHGHRQKILLINQYWPTLGSSFYGKLGCKSNSKFLLKGAKDFVFEPHLQFLKRMHAVFSATKPALHTHNHNMKAIMRSMITIVAVISFQKIYTQRL